MSKKAETILSWMLHQSIRFLHLPAPLPTHAPATSATYSMYHCRFSFGLGFGGVALFSARSPRDISACLRHPTSGDDHVNICFLQLCVQVGLCG
jgi:hypothetical protein